VEIQSFDHEPAEPHPVAALGAFDIVGYRADEPEPALRLFEQRPIEQADPVVDALRAVLRIARCQPGAAPELFISTIQYALELHLTRGCDPNGSRPAGLAPWQERRAKEFLAKASKSVSITQAAAACRLSRSYFTKAFKATTGDTPFRWLIKHRIEKAKELLFGAQTIAQIALDCGFSDQSHLTRVFSDIVGAPPGLWRRNHRDM